MGQLTVLLEKCIALQDNDMIGKSDPYITLTLKKGGTFGASDAGQQKSSVKKDELDPVYNETFHFNLPELKDHSLYMSVKDEDAGTDDTLGACEVDLEKVDGLADGNTCSYSSIIDGTMFKTGNAKIFVSLTWKP